MWAAFEGPVPLRCVAGPDRARSAAPRARQTAAPRAHHRPGPRGPPRPPAHRPARPRPGRRSADHRLRPAPRAARPRRLTLLPDPDTPPARPRPGRRQPSNPYPSTDLVISGHQHADPCSVAVPSSRGHAQPRGTPCPSPLKTITTVQDQATTRGSRSDRFGDPASLKSVEERGTHAVLVAVAPLPGSSSTVPVKIDQRRLEQVGQLVGEGRLTNPALGGCDGHDPAHRRSLSGGRA